MIVRFSFIFSFLITSCLLTAQELQPVYQQFTEQDGLPSNYLNCLFQDSKGFIWIGSDKGLTRFDGVSFKTFTTDDGLSGNMILDVEEDEVGQLWIGTFERGLCRFDGEKFECWGKEKGITTVNKLLKPIGGKLFYSEGAGKLAQFDMEKKQNENLIDFPMTGIDNSMIPISEHQIIFPFGNQVFQVSKEGKVDEVFSKKTKGSFFFKKGIATPDGKFG